MTHSLITMHNADHISLPIKPVFGFRQNSMDTFDSSSYCITKKTAEIFTLYKLVYIFTLKRHTTKSCSINYYIILSFLASNVKMKQRNNKHKKLWVNCIFSFEQFILFLETKRKPKPFFAFLGLKKFSPKKNPVLCLTLWYYELLFWRDVYLGVERFC